MFNRIRTLGLLVASVATCGLLFLFDAPAAEAAVATVSGPAVHKVRGQIVSFTAPVAGVTGNLSPTITVEVQRKAADGTARVENKTFPVVAGAPIQLIGNGTTQALTPAALQPGRRAMLLVGNGAVNEIDLFAPPATTVSYLTDGTYNPSYAVYAPEWVVGPHRHYFGWNSWYGGGWGHTFVGTSHHGVVGHHAHVGHVKTGTTGHKTLTGHGGHTGHHGSKGHHAHGAGHAHHGGHGHSHGGGHHK